MMFHPLVQTWFERRFKEPTEPQRLGWPHIAAGRNTLIAAPTGSGKTLTAFMVCLDRLIRQSLEGTLPEGIQVVYVSPLKALSNDIERNLQTPLKELRKLASELGLPEPPVRVAVRTGDTPSKDRQAMLRTPPHILVTTPESLYLLLTSAKSRDHLRSVKTVIVDEIHALARDKRGSHLSLTLERLAHLCTTPPIRIGLSATQKPIDEIGAFLVGSSNIESQAPNPESQSACEIIDAGHVRQLDLEIETPPSELGAVCTHEQWGEVYERLVELIQTHRSTLVFVNTRRLAERIAHALRERLGEDAVASHHGSLSRDIRLDAELRLKAGQLKAIVATASLEMGIDIGYIDLVCQIGSPRAIATFLQRVGRSGHSLGLIPKGRLFPLTRDELLECLALVRAVKQRRLDAIEIPIAPLDILAQQIVAACAADEWDEEALFQLFRRAYPYRDLERKDFDNLVRLLCEGIQPGRNKAGAYLHRDLIHGKLRARRGARLTALTSGGAIPEKAEFRVVTEDEGAFIGSVDEDFAIDSSAGDVFLLGNSSWRILRLTQTEVIVGDAKGAPPTIPFWFGEAPGRTIELSREVGQVRGEVAKRIVEGESPTAIAAAGDPIAWLQTECNASPWAAEQAVRYVAAQKAAMGLVPTCEQIVFERFFDESGGMQLVVHAPFGARINRAWGLAFRKRFCRSFDFELQAAADDNGLMLSLGPQHSFPLDSLFHMLGPHNGQQLLEQAALAAPMFQVRWRWNVTRSLAVLRMRGGKKVPPFLQKFRANDLLASAFPETVGCLENHHGDVEIPDHPLVQQTMRDCLHEAMDVTRWVALLGEIKNGAVKLIPFDSREPSPFSHQLLNAAPYAFLDDAPLEERRTRAISTRRTLAIDDFTDLARLDEAAIDQVASEAWPVVRDAEELHDALQTLVLIPESDALEWRPWFRELVKSGRACEMSLVSAETYPSANADRKYLVAAERLPFARALHPTAKFQPELTLPAALDISVEPADARLELIRGWMEHSGPVTADELGAKFQLPALQMFAALESVEASGLVLRGQFRSPTGPPGSTPPPQFCNRRLLARIHRLTLDGLRRRIQPVMPVEYVDFLTRWHRLVGDPREGELGLRDALAQLQGFELPAGAWEKQVLAPRLAEYDPQWLDRLFLSGEAMWGRLRPPKRQEKDGPGIAAMTRTMPMSLLLREDLSWLLPEDRADVSGYVAGNAHEAHCVLQTKGALFFADLKGLSGLLPSQLEDALRELAAFGLITSDTFAAVRSIVGGSLGKSVRFGQRVIARHAPAGRWSLFPGYVAPIDKAEHRERWCRQLLARYGVLFRDLLTREYAAPSWYELAPTLRRMELRGEVRGGRFVSGVAGEQFALESAVTLLRETRDTSAAAGEGSDDWCVISAADPLNLTGILTKDRRITASHKSAIILQRGKCVAAKESGRIELFEQFAPGVELAMRRALQTGMKLRRREPPLAPAPASPLPPSAN